MSIEPGTILELLAIAASPMQSHVLLGGVLGVTPHLL